MTPARFGSLWPVGAVLVAGLVAVVLGHVRSGGFLFAGAMVAAAVFRLVLPPAGAGGLVVRSRLFDVLVLLGMSVALIVIVASLDLQSRG